MQVPIRSDFSEVVNYNIPDFPIYARRAFLSSYPNYCAVSHWHDDVEFTFLVSGSMDYSINGSIVTLHANEGVFINSRQLHYGFSPSHTEADLVCILLHPQLLCASDYVKEHFVMPILSNSSCSYCKLSPDVPWQNTILDALRQLYGCADSPAFVLRAQRLGFCIWEALSEHLSMAKTAPAVYQNLAILNNMIGYIQKNYADKITLADIAEAGHVCKSTCSSIFLNNLKCSPMAFLTDYRLNKSLELLNNTDLTITKISYEVGFSGASYFTETFRRHFHCTPTEYRTQQTGLWR